MSSRSSLVLLALGASLVSVSAAHAQTGVISFSFSGNSDSPQYVAAKLAAGVVPAMNFSFDNGGSIGGSPADTLTYSDGTSSTATLSSYKAYDSQSGKLASQSDYSNNGNEQLLNGYIESGPPAATNAAATFTISSVPYASYSLYVYAYNGASQFGTYTVTPSGSITGTSQDAMLQSTFDPANPFTQATATTAGDYLLFTGLTGSSFTLTANRTTGDTSSTTFIPIDGFQIVATPAAVPEASTTVSLGLLLALGLGGFAVARKKASSVN